MADTFLQRELRRLMKKHGLSARALSLKAGLNETFVKAVLAGRSRNPRTDTLGAIADVFGLKTDDLTGPKRPEEDYGPKIRRLPVSQRDKAIDAIHTLRDLLDPDDGNQPLKRGTRK